MAQKTRFTSIAVLLWALSCTGVAGAEQPAGVTQSQLMSSQNIADLLASKRRELDELLWQPEVLAQKYEARFVQLWDQLRSVPDKFEVLARFPFKTLSIGAYKSGEPLGLNIARYEFGPGGTNLDPANWAEFIQDLKKNGYELVQTEWHHSRFEPPAGDNPARSEVRFELHVARPDPAHRVVLRGTLGVTWAAQFDAAGMPVPETIAVKKMELLERERPPVFEEVMVAESSPQKPRVQPLAVYDLNGDGLSEIVLGGQNLVVWNLGGGQFETRQFLQDERSIFDAAILADFTGDGPVDFVAVDDQGVPLLFEGDAEGRFDKPGVEISEARFILPKVFTAGDVDADGDLDLYIANYKFPYRQGQWPTPYYDANDGYPAYLLRNDGEAGFTDITEQAGLSEKRFRRAYSGSFVDLDEDKDMDLLVVSDFAGFDTYINNGDGTFTDVSDDFGLDRHFFGMSHTFADYDLDAKLDFYVIGMSSTTAKRLEQMGIGREDKPEHNAMRAAMGYGNRMFMGGDDFGLAGFNDSVARSGWSWGASSFDMDNDGDKDIFVANGHYSGKSAQDYCTTFWRHDIYTEGSDNSLARDLLFQTQSSELRSADISWNGFEHKAMFMNREGKDFVNVAFLLGAAFEYDGRGVVADDLDADGRVDLLVVEFKTAGEGKDKYTLHVYRNVMQEAGHWVGIRLRDHKGLSPIGATIKVKTAAGMLVDQIVTGDSFSSQHPATVHFGLGSSTAIESIEVNWPNGTVARIEEPAADTYHWVDPPKQAVSKL